MKKLAFYLLTILMFSIHVNAQWVECNYCPECLGGIINGDAIMSFIIDGNNTYSGGVGGVYKTTNNGENWIPKNKGLKTIINVIVISSLAIDGNNIFAGTWFDGIFMSKDKGENWFRKSNGLPCQTDGDTLFLTNIYDIIIVDNNIFASTTNGIYLSTNKGDNWTLKNNGLPQDTFKRDVFSMAVSGNKIFAGTLFGVYMTTNNGDNWIPKKNGMGNLSVSSLTINENNIYAGALGNLFLSIDNGDNWKIMKDSIAVEGIMIKENNIFVCGYGIYLSTDNGINWDEKNSGLHSKAVDPLIINGDYIFAGVDNYGIYRAKLSDLGITDVKESEQKNENVIFPNPVTDKLTIQSKNDFNTHFEIINLLGIKVLTGDMLREFTSINVSHLSKGLYFLKAGSIIKKFVKE